MKEFGYGRVDDATVIGNMSMVKQSAGKLIAAADEAWSVDLATTQANFISTFAGVSVEPGGHANGGGDKSRYPFALEGVFEFDCASSTFAMFQLVGPAKQSGNALENHKVVAVATANLAIGYVTKAYVDATVKVFVRVFERMSGLNVGTSALLKDGTVVPTANLPMGTYKLTGLGAGSGAGDSVRYEQAILAAGTNAFSAAQAMGGFRLTGLGAPTTAADAARVDDVTTPGTAALSIEAEGTPGADDIRLTIQLKDAKNANLATKRVITLWMSAADGGLEEAITDMAVTTGVMLREEVANACMRIATDATGLAIVTLNKTGGAATKYACVEHTGNQITTVACTWS